MAAAAPGPLDAVLRADPASRAQAARRALAVARPYEEWRPALATALAADPSRAAPAFEALASASAGGADRALHGRLLTFQGHAEHRAGRMDRAVACYERAERALSRAGAEDEAMAAAIARIDALAACGRTGAALALATALARRAKGPRRRRAAGAIAANRGNVLRLRGDVDEAARAYATAVRTFDGLGDTRRAAITRLNAGVAAVEAGDAGAGRTAIAAAERALGELGYADLAIEARANLAWADVHAGRLGDGIRALDRLAEEHRAAGLARREGVCRMDLADALRRAGDATTATREAVKAAACFRAASAPAERAEALLVAAACDEAAGASPRSHARLAHAAAVESGREALALRAELAAAGATGRGRVARANLGRIVRRARALGHRALEADARLLEGTLALAAGRTAAARGAFEAARRLSSGRPWTRLSAEAGLAETDARRPGGLPRALRRLRDIAAFHEEVRADLPGGWLRSRFVTDRLDPFLVRVDLLLARGRPEDRAEAAATLDALAARRVLLPRARRRDARTERIRARLESIYDRIGRGEGPTRGGDGSSTEALERRAHAWERAFVARRRLGERRAPAASSRHAPTARDVPSDVTAIHVWCRGDDVFGLVRQDGEIGPAVALGTARTFAVWAAGARLQARSFAYLRGETPGGDLSARALLSAMSDKLLPALGAERWSRRVHVTIDPRLPDVPLELLPWKGAPLALSHDVLRTPLGHRAPVARASGAGTVVVGVSAPDLAGVDAEVRAVADVLKAEEALLGAAATRSALSRALSSAAVVHVAGHGWDASEAPPLSGIRLADGWFCADDVPDVVAADLVVLAACRTGRASGPAALAWGGLVARLLSSGARRVVWTDDDVDDRAAARVMVAYHATRRGWDDVSAFGRALARVADESNHPGAVLPFRISGVEA